LERFSVGSIRFKTVSLVSVRGPINTHELGEECERHNGNWEKGFHGLRLVQLSEDQDFLLGVKKTAITQANLIGRTRRHNAKKFSAAGQYPGKFIGCRPACSAIRRLTNRAKQTWKN
jgi:hypothetical protein